MKQRGTKLCVAGTMSDYAAIVSHKPVELHPLAAGAPPYSSHDQR